MTRPRACCAASRNGTPIEIGVFDGRLRLRGGHYWLHLVAVAGDPEWTDYQIDVDIYNFNDPALAGKGPSRPGQLPEVRSLRPTERPKPAADPR